MTADERRFAIDRLQQGRERMMRSAASAEGADWNRKPSPEGWSPAECLEHVVIVERLVLARLESGKPEAVEDPRGSERDGRLVRAVADRGHKVTAPERARPSGGWALEQALQWFTEVRDRSIAFAESTNAPLRETRWRHPFFGPIDGYQTLLVLAGHGDRHAAQIEEILARQATL